MTPECDRIVLRSIACHGRVNIGNFDSGLQTCVSNLIATGMVTSKIDSASHDTLWCYLTDSGREYLLDLNQSVPPMWYELDLSSQPSAEESPVSA